MIERELRSLDVAFPPAPDVTGAVLARIERRRRVWLAPALAALAVAGALLAIPQTRAAILDLFRIGGVTVERVESQPRPAAPSGPLGTRVELAEAQAAVDFPLLVPDGRVAVWREGPIVTTTFGRHLLMQFRGEQLPYVQKQLGPGSRLVNVGVRGTRGVWVTGARHEVVYRLPGSDEVRFVERRTAGDVLIWEDGEVTYRLEGARTLDEALAVARDLRAP